MQYVNILFRMPLKLRLELNYIPNVRRFLSIVHVLRLLEDPLKAPFQHIHEHQAMEAEERLCMVQQHQVGLMEVEHRCMDRKHQCTENLAHGLPTMDHR